MRKRGRRTKLTAAVQRQIVDGLRAGAFRSHAARAAGVSESTLAGWLARGDRDEQPYAAFAIEVRKALALSAIQCQAAITRAALGVGPIGASWRAAAWSLEKRFPKEYGRAAMAAAVAAGEPEGDRATVMFYVPGTGADWRVDDD